MPYLRAGLHLAGQLVALALADQVAHGRRGDQHLDGGRAARAVRASAAAAGSRPPAAWSPASPGSGPAGPAGTRRRCGRRSAARDCVCRVAKTRWPVSAAVSAMWIVSRSRISPTRITSGSWRRTRFERRRRSVLVSSPTSRWLTMRHLVACAGTRWGPRRTGCGRPWSRLMMSSSAASVVDLPDPVGPVTSTRPRGRSANVAMIAGMCRAARTWGCRRGSCAGRRRSRRAGGNVHRGTGSCRGSRS